MTGPRRGGWRLEHDEVLFAAITKGMSYSAAVAALNERFGTDFSRNAAISRATRLGLRSSGIPNGSNRNGHVRMAMQSAKPKIIAPAPPIVPGKPVGLLDLRLRHCRAPLDERGDDGLMLFCGAPTIRGSSWCAVHYERYVQGKHTMTTSQMRIWEVMKKAFKDGTVPFGHYGPETCRWATHDEMQRFGLQNRPLVHIDQTNGEIDCFFTETAAVVVRQDNAVH